MTVDEMLDRLPAREVTEWQAFEFVFGPLGTSYGDDLLAGIYEQLQALNHDPKDDPVQPFPRRHQYMEHLRSIYEAEREEEMKTDEERAAEIAAFGVDM